MSNPNHVHKYALLNTTGAVVATETDPVLAELALYLMCDMPSKIGWSVAEYDDEGQLNRMATIVDNGHVEQHAEIN